MLAWVSGYCIGLDVNRMEKGMESVSGDRMLRRGLEDAIRQKSPATIGYYYARLARGVMQRTEK